MTDLHVLRVFTGDDGAHGNPLGVFLDGSAVPEADRQRAATELGFSETVFVDDRETAQMRIFTPGYELPFAGHPTVGTAWLLAQEGVEAGVLRPLAGDVAVRREGELTFVAAPAGWSPPWELIEFGDAAEVDRLTGPPAGETLVYCWAWADEAEGKVRSRCWSLDDGIGEDEATGSAAIMLAERLGREVTITQGRGSQLVARPLGAGRAEVGGLVVLEERREFNAVTAR